MPSSKYFKSSSVTFIIVCWLTRLHNGWQVEIVFKLPSGFILQQTHCSFIWICTHHLVLGPLHERHFQIVRSGAQIFVFLVCEDGESYDVRFRMAMLARFGCRHLNALA